MTIKLVLFDVDGVLSDCTLYLGPNNLEIKRFNVKDGLGIEMLHQAGIETGVISGRPGQSTLERMQSLKMKYIHLAVKDKMAVYEGLLEALNLTDANVAYMGDDLPDLPLLKRVGLSACPADAVAAVQAQSQFVSQYNGGQGAVRELCDFILAGKALTGKA